MLSTYLNLIFHEFKGSTINKPMIYTSWRWFKVRVDGNWATRTWSNNKTGMLSNSDGDHVFWATLMVKGLLAPTRPFNTWGIISKLVFRLECWSYAVTVIVYHWLHWTTVTCEPPTGYSMVSPWSCHGIAPRFDASLARWQESPGQGSRPLTAMQSESFDLEFPWTRATV